MEIVDVKPYPYENAIFPSIRFDVTIKYMMREEAILSLNGWLGTDDEKIIAEVKEIAAGKSKEDEVAARGSSQDKNIKEGAYKTKLIAVFNDKSLEYIEKRRLASDTRDVNLNLNLNVVSITSRARISQLRELDGGDMQKLGLKSAEVYSGSRQTSEWGVMIGTSDPEFSPTRSNQWILSGSDGPVFLTTHIHKLSFSLTEDKAIKSSDWTHKYAPTLGLGEYFIVEIPKGNKTIRKAWDYVEKADVCFKTWDTKGVYANCREASKVLNKKIEEKFKGNPIKKKWKRAISNFETDSSLNLHIEDIYEEKPKGEVIIGKADTERMLIVTKALVKYAEELINEGANQ